MSRPPLHGTVTNEWRDPSTPDPLRAALDDVYRALVSEHGHSEAHEAVWPACLPVHIAMNRYRAALAGDRHEDHRLFHGHHPACDYTIDGSAACCCGAVRLAADTAPLDADTRDPLCTCDPGPVSWVRCPKCGGIGHRPTSRP